MLTKLFKTGWIAAAMIGAATATAGAKEWNTSTERAPLAGQFAKIYGETLPPIGWVKFCQRHRSDCTGRPGRAARVRLTDSTWMQMVRVNALVNRKIEPVTDLELYKTAEHWTYPARQGDCEDYVLLKRKYLINLGWPREALLVTVVLDEKREGHAVLTVVTDQGEFILDNQNPEVLPWRATPYTYIKRQAQEHPQSWVSLTPRATKRRARNVAGRSGSSSDN